jgi:hypothetical protein
VGARESRGGQRVVLALGRVRSLPLLLVVPLPADHLPPVRPYPEDILSCEWYYKQPMAPYDVRRPRCGPSRLLLAHWPGSPKLPQIWA